MSIALLFPGIHSVLRSKDRGLVLDLPEVQQRLARANAVLAEGGASENLGDYLTGDASTLASTSNVHLTAISACAVQLGITDRLQSLGIRPEWVMGCSLGDLARSVFSGLIRFETVVAVQLQLFKSYRNLGGDYQGINLGIRAAPCEPFTEADFEWFEGNGITPSRMAPRFLQLSVSPAQYKKLCDFAANRNWSLRRAEFDLLLHADQLQPLSDAAIAGLEDTALGDPTVKIYSSILNKPLLDLEAIVDEAKQILWRPLQWQDAILSLQASYGVRDFINIGPCKSLSALQRQISPGCRAREASCLIRG